MVSRSKANIMQIIGCFIMLILHVLYADFALGIEVGGKIVGWVIVTLCAIVGSLFVIQNRRISEMVFILTVVVASHFLGIELRTMPYALAVYMVYCIMMIVIGDATISVGYIVIVNAAIFFGLVTNQELIDEIIGINYYVILIMLCEIMLFMQYWIVRHYLQKVQELEKQNKLLQKAQKSKDEFLANMSHEIRTPMNAILGMTELISKEDDISDKVGDYCYNIQSSGENLMGMINDILDFSKIESGKMSIYYEPYSILSMVQNVVNTAMIRRGFKDVEIIIDCNPLLPKQLIGDVMRNRQILMNIVTNAVKYTNKGSIFISVSCYEKECCNWLRLEVMDTGVGIKEEDKEYLFDAFRRFDSVHNRSVEGTGLGLTLCKKITQAMNGMIEIESEYNWGTRVTVDIPQEIDDPSPFLEIENASDIRVALYDTREITDERTRESYKITNSNIWNGFGISYCLIASFEELMDVVQNGAITHLYTGVEEYVAQTPYLEKIADKIKVFVMHDPHASVKFGGNVQGVQLPFYSVNLANSLNENSFYSHYIDGKNEQISFQAPYARVLIVDDNDVNLRVAEGVVKLFGVQCVLAHSGREAIELLKSQDIDLVFMDYMMPEMDGVETTQIIRRIGGEYGRRLPVVALTANVVNNANEMFRNHGFQDFLPKPISVKTVNHVLRRWLPGTKIELKDESVKRQIPEFDESEGNYFVVGSISKDSAKVDLDQRRELFDNTVAETPSTEKKNEVLVDAKTALENMGNQRELYIELLEYCIELEKQRKIEIEDSFSKQDWAEYAIRVHALKGGMRSLGVEMLAEIAHQQEKAAKEKRYEDVVAGHDELMRVYDLGHRSIEKYLATYCE